MKIDEKFGINMLNLILIIDGLVFAIIYGSIGKLDIDSMSKHMLFLYKLGLTSFCISLILGVLCYKFIVSVSQEDNLKSAMKDNSVAITFFLSWFTFLIGITFYTFHIVYL